MFVFPCNRWFSLDEDDRAIERDLSANFYYDISIFTSDIRGAGTDSSVYIYLYGTENKTGNFLKISY
jgi:hypothetical protein